MRPLLLALIAALPVSLLLPGCGPPERTPSRALASLVDSHELREDRSVYDRDNLAEVPVIRITIWDLEAFEDVLEDRPGAEVDVLFQEGTFGAGRDTPNGIMRQRGGSVRLAHQKSWKIKLNDGVGRWKNQKSINLLKNPWDLTRVRGWLAWEHLKAVRHMTSWRHQFVHLFINGEDQGLYEWIEEASDNMLEDHGLDKDGTLYKANKFLFRPYTDDIFDCQEGADQCLEVENKSDPAKLRRMLAAVNDENQDINDVIDRYFERNNYETWLACMILMSNYDTASQNYFLYSPRGSERWYFLPWDFNGAWSFRQQPDWRIQPPRRDLVAPGYWWRVNLHRRFLSDPVNVEALRDRLDALRTYPLTDARSRRILEAAYGVVRSFVERQPDISYLPVSDWSFPPEEKLREWQAEWTRLGYLLSRARREFDQTVEWPMPVVVRTPRRDGSRVRFSWEETFDIQGDRITYDLKVLRGPDLRTAEVVAERRRLTGTDASIGGLRDGTYYFTVIARDDDDPDEHWQIPNYRYADPRSFITYPGVRQFRVPVID